MGKCVEKNSSGFIVAGIAVSTLVVPGGLICGLQPISRRESPPPPRDGVELNTLQIQRWAASRLHPRGGVIESRRRW